MTALLTDNLPLLAGAPNGIKKLRELILELAARGKLVPQDPNDEPASELLKRIADEKARLVAEGKIKKPKSSPDVETLEKLYDLPAGWEWTTLPGAANYQIGKTPPTKEAKYWDDSGLPWVSISDMEHYGEITETSRRVSEIASKDIFKYKPVPAGTLLMSFKLTVGKVAVLGIDAYHNEAIISLSPYNGVSKDYLFRFLPSIALGGQQKNALMGNTLNSESMAQLLVPIPPLAEQHRIVAKVDELMTLCDRLEAQQADAESAHAQLVHALLDSLTQASDATAMDGGNAENAGAIFGHDFAANWQRLSEHFHTLFTTESSIDALKQTLLQLAVMGKLVPQDPNDAPASELLKRIAEEKARLVAAGQIKKQKPFPEISEEERPFQLPKSWMWTRLGNLAGLITSGSRDWAQHYSKEGAIFVRMGNLSRRSYELRQKKIQRISPPEDGEGSRTKLEAGDLLISITGEVGLLGLIPDGFGEAYINQHVCLVRFVAQLQDRFLPEMLRSPFAYEQYEAPQRGIKNSFRLTDVSEMLVPLPPLPEQHRIVAKLDQLMTLCDQLKARLIQARQLNEQLASTLVEQALA